MDVNVFYIHIFKAAGNAVKAPVQFADRLEKIRCWYNFDIPPSHSWHWDNLTDEERERVWFFSGHFRNGNTWEKLRALSSRPPLFFTVLRDPVERVISSYYYDRLDKCAKDPLHKYFKQYSLEECLDADFIYSHFEKEDRRRWKEILENHQTRILSGEPHWHPQNKPLAPGGKAWTKWQPINWLNLKRAKSHLCFFSLVGFTETLYNDWDKVYKPLLRGTEIPEHLLNQKANETPDKPRVSKDVREKIAEWNRYDIELYEWAKKQEIGY